MADINQKLISILSQLSNSLELGFSDDEVYEFIVNKFKRAFNVKYGFGVAFDRTLKGIELVEGSINIGNDVENVDEVKVRL